MNRAYRLAKEGGWILSGQISSVIGSLVLVRVLTGYLEPSEYGQLALGLTFASLINQLVMAGLIAGIGRFYSIAVELNAFSSYIKASIRLLIIALSVVIGITALLMLILFFFGYTQWTGLVLTALTLSIFSGCSSALNAVQVAARQRSKAALLSGVDSGLKIVFSVGAIALFGPSGTSVIIGYAASSLLIMILQLYFLKFLSDTSDAKASELPNWERQIWMYAMPFSMWGIFTWAQQASDRWALQYFGDSDEVGLYAVIFQLGYVPIGVAVSFIISFVGPILYSRVGSGLDSRRNKSVHLVAMRIFAFIISLTIVVFIFSLFFHQWIFKLLVAERYGDVSYLLPWMILAGGAFASGQMLSLKLMAEMKTQKMTIVKIVSGIFCLAMYLYGAKSFGLPGVVGASVLFGFIYASWMFYISRSAVFLSNNLEYNGRD